MPFSEVVTLIEQSKGAAALAEKQLWDALQLYPEKIPDNQHADVACVASCLGAIGRQYESFLQMLGGCHRC